MDKKSIVYQMSRNIVVIILIASLGVFIATEKGPYLIGLLIGGFISVIKIIMMEASLSKAVLMPSHRAGNYAKAHYFLRMLITFLALAVGVYTPQIGFIGLVIGLYALKPAAFLQGILDPKVPKDGSVEFLEWEDDEEDESDF
ncbi:MAG: ATP synthase subunit I [Vallitaleaceae bacterium]|nr:ATP synthase subunit I [Vallitaleaceae bacterium]